MGGPASYDAIVVGLGAMGSAAVYQLAKAGARVLGIDRYHPPHELGSTHGRTRITRLALGEGSEYVPLVKRSHELWREIEAESGESLMTQTGMLLIGAERAAPLHGADDFLATTLAAAREHDVPHELLDAAAMAARFPQFAFSGDERGGFYEPTAGFVRPERAVAAQLALAERHGATLRFGERVQSVSRGRVDDHVADRVIVTAGAWVGELLGDERFAVYRQVQYWFETTAYEQHRDMPIFIWDLGGAPDDFVYGFPAIDGPEGGVKVATEQHERATTPDACARDVDPREPAEMHERYLAGRVPGLTARCVRATTCLYTVTPDRRWVIDDDDGVILASPCAGHGFKHSPAIGEILAQLVATGRSELDVSAL